MWSSSGVGTNERKYFREKSGEQCIKLTCVDSIHARPALLGHARDQLSVSTGELCALCRIVRFITVENPLLALFAATTFTLHEIDRSVWLRLKRPNERPRHRFGQIRLNGLVITIHSTIKHRKVKIDSDNINVERICYLFYLT